MLIRALSWLWSSLMLGMTQHTLAFFVALLVLYVIHWIRERRYKQSLFERLGIPYIKPHLIYGSMHVLRGKTLATEIFGKWIEKYGKVFGYFIGSTSYVIVSDLDLIRQVLVKDFHNFSNRPKLAIEALPVIHTVVGLRDQRWKDVRSVLTPTFSMVKLKEMIGIMNFRVDELLGIIEDRSSKDEPIEMYELFQGLTLDVICECVLAMKRNCQRDQRKDEFFEGTRSFLKNAMNPAIHLAIYFSVFGKVLGYISNKFALSGRMTNMIVSHLQTVLSIRRKDLSTKHIDVLQLMLEAAEPLSDTSSNNKESQKGSMVRRLTDEEIIANAWVFLLAGFETTANSLTSTIYLLACNPDIQDKLYEELCEHFEDGHESLTYETVHKLTYLDQVFSESLRVYPPVISFITRDTNDDYQLGDYLIPSGTNVMIPVWQIHHDPKLWPDPYKFDPDRFAPEVKASETRHPMSYIPFGAGPRGCPGIRFAQLESKLTIARLVKCYRLETCAETPIPLTFIMPTVTHIPEKDVMIKAVRRE